MNEHDFESIISQDLENLSVDELLAMSESLTDDNCPEPKYALIIFKRDYLPEASEVSLYDDEPRRKSARRINLKHIVAVAAVVALMAACSLVSYAAGVASSSGKGGDKTTTDTSKSEEKPLKTGVEIDGTYGELYVIKPVDEDADDYSYSQNKLVNKVFMKPSEVIYNNWHYADLDGNVLKFEEITYGDEGYDELCERLKQKGKDLYDAKFIEDLNGVVSGIDLIELSDVSCRRFEADDYFLEYLMGANYEIVSRDPFTQVYDKLYVNYDTNFQMETRVIMYAECYNPEKGTYQEFVTSKTAVGPFEVVYEIPEGWMLIDGRMVLQNQLEGTSTQNLRAYSNDEAKSASELAAFREKLNAALEKYHQEKVERNNIIEKIEENQNS